ncbi:hypothetical protein [Cupriavidus numazuensis]|uniref:Uncharacterized protein n=1 Tax=Cupriavidus numazuensis TaxID=221992 RepID=A0ABN7QAE4_9BURK|nr:hypothetical protein [Cupriavidus numazuensis]CAG2159269.1 hypothetical protein LMG26411_06571 [Cupriavidus numazuensis]
MGSFFEDGWKVAPAIGIAHDYYRRAAEAGDFRGQFNCVRLAAVSGNHAHAADWIAVVPQTATDAFLDKCSTFFATHRSPDGNVFTELPGVPCKLADAPPAFRLPGVKRRNAKRRQASCRSAIGSQAW